MGGFEGVRGTEARAGQRPNQTQAQAVPCSVMEAAGIKDKLKEVTPDGWRVSIYFGENGHVDKLCVRRLAVLIRGDQPLEAFEQQLRTYLLNLERDGEQLFEVAPGPLVVFPKRWYPEVKCIRRC